MKHAHLALAAIALAFALPASAEALEIAGTPAAKQRIDRHLDAIEASSGVEITITSAGSGKALLDLVEGRVAVAALSGTLDEAVASAKSLAQADGKSLAMPITLKFHEIAKAPGDDHPVGFVTIGAPVPELQKVLMYLRSHEGRSLMVAGH